MGNPDTLPALSLSLHSLGPGTHLSSRWLRPEPWTIPDLPPSPKNVSLLLGALGTAMLHGRRIALVDDSYNANPDSVRAAIDMLAGLPGPHWLVLGDMG